MSKLDSAPNPGFGTLHVGAGTTTLPLRIFVSLRFGVSPIVNATAAMMLGLTLTATVVAYVKLRRRGSIDFPIAGAAVAMRLDGSTVTSCRIVLSAVASHPLEAAEASEFMIGKQVDEESVRAAAEIAAKPAKPLDNADLSHFWRKRMVRVVVEQALQRAIDQ